MPHQYKRRTMDEAVALAQRAFRSSVCEHLSEVEIRELEEHGTMISGSPQGDWEPEIGFAPDIRAFYEVQLYRPSDECPYITGYYARILVSRDRTTEEVWIKWKPPVPVYSGPWFS